MGRAFKNVDLSSVTKGAGNAAQAAQRKAGYLVDDFTEITLKKGDIVYGGSPGQSAWYTDFASVKSSGLKKDTLFQGLQVKPHETLGYRPQVTAYRVAQDVRVAGGIARANSGIGGYQQFYFPNYSDVLSPIRSFNLR